MNARIVYNRWLCWYGAIVFLISLKTRGTGLNLTAADYVIHTVSLVDEIGSSSPSASTRCCASVIDDLQGIRQYFLTLTHTLLQLSTRFFRTVLIDTFEHKLIAISKQR